MMLLLFGVFIKSTVWERKRKGKWITIGMRVHGFCHRHWIEHLIRAILLKLSMVCRDRPIRREIVTTDVPAHIAIHADICRLIAVDGILHLEWVLIGHTREGTVRTKRMIGHLLS